jgi:Tol biopolymer transport system component
MGTPALRRVTPPGYEAFAPSWSGDGQWIYFARTGRPNTDSWRIPAAGGESVQITGHGGFASAESYDGKQLYFAKENRRLVDARGPAESGGFSLGFFDFATRRTRTLARIPDNPYNKLAVSPDGKTILFAMLRSLDWDLIMIDNFR